MLQILLILQNRGRQTSVELARELEVAPRTILRDVDAMTEAGLPIIVHQGNRGGIELGFNYRTRLTGLAQDEAEALGLILGARNPLVAAMGLQRAAAQARAKLVESFPDRTRAHVTRMTERFAMAEPEPDDDPRIGALARAVKAGTVVRLQFASPAERIVHPVGMELGPVGWMLRDGKSKAPIPISEWGRVNISTIRFERRPD